MAELDGKARDLLFLKARTNNGWLDQPLSDDTLKELYELLRWGPTAQNCCPARFVFVTSKEAKEKLRPALSEGNVDKTMAAPATAIVAYDLRFFEKMTKLVPHNPKAGERFEGKPEAAAAQAAMNGTLQGGYFILAARSVGLDCGPMAGFSKQKVDDAFFPEGRWKSNFLCNLGYGDPEKVRPRAPRLDFDEACAIL
ncbi:malonic semialdehyde reductase [Limibacillus halophilus]